MKTDPDVDNVLVECVESLQTYFDDHHVLCTKLKQGFLMLTRARMRLPEHTLSEISYHGEFEASRVVTLDSEGNWRLHNASEVEELNVTKKSGDATLHHRRAGTSYPDDDPVSSKTGLDASTLLWFSSLPPSDLRQAQKQFSNGLQTLLLAASSAQKVQKAVHDVMTAPR
ncbi:unnamed protein product [Peronospora destructor]|uniref:Vacuolar ATPase assembly protein VMA22 n=1 Tax=Peronospora destructor TaxID=86335 RepID=A0AAV0U928_9STRA|nr:unnamed protein product [Peronospora destructor]